MDDNETRQRILDTAGRLFGERGKAAVSTTEIAKAAGINKAMIFYYFGSKDELYAAALKKWFSDFGESLRVELSGLEPGLPTIEAFVRAHTGYLLKHPELVRLIIRELIASDFSSPTVYKEALQPFHVIRDRLLGSLEIARERGEIRDVDPLHTAVNIISMDVFVFLGKPIVQGINPDIDMEKFIEERVHHILDLLMNGLRKKPE
jgi:TetR/AcrR family transcriptional regulator